MSYVIEPLGNGADDEVELAEFLARFVKAGELRGAPSEDGEASCWLRRMGWWWASNPFCRPDSPRGFTLRTGGGELVGFHGLIPFDYVAGGTSVPGLISSIFFVFTEHRAGSMGMFMRVQRLTQEFHVVDGGPSDDVVRILERFGYRRGGARTFFPYFCGFGWRKRPLKPGLKLISEPGGVRSIPGCEDNCLRPVITRESLEWMAKVGGGRRQFFGVCEVDGRLVAYALGIYKKLPGGFQRCQIVDYFSFDESRCSVSDLLEHVVSNRKGIPLLPKTLMLLWGVENGATHPRRRMGFRRGSKVYFCGPKNRESMEKAVYPIEGDFSFF